MKRHVVILVANMLLAALLFSAHHWVAIAKNQGDYTPFAASSAVSAITYDETHAYAPQAQRFMSDGEVPAEVDNYERRTASAAIPFFPIMILGAMGRTLGSIERAFIAADVVFPAIALVLLYISSEGIVQSVGLRLLLAWATLLIPFAPRNFFWLGYDALISAPDFTRTPQPEFSFTLLLVGLLITARALRPDAKRRTAVFAGFIGALIVASYYFYSLVWGIALGILLVVALVWQNWTIVKRVGLVLSVTLIASVPYLLLAARGQSEKGQTYLLTRMGAYTHTIRLFPMLVLIVGVLMVWKFGEPWFTGGGPHRRMGVLTLALLAGFAGLNFQVLSGYDAQHGHFWNRLILPLGFFLGGCWLFSAIENFPGCRRWLKPVGAVFLVCILLTAGIRQVFVANRTAGFMRASRPESELLLWVRSNVPNGSVIGTADPTVLLMLPAMAPDFSYVPAGLRSLTSNKEIADRYYELASMFGWSVADLETNLKSDEHFNQPHLLWVLGLTGDMTYFVDGYRNHREEHGSARRLDYVVFNSGGPIPAPLTKKFSNARVLHVNGRYQLIGLR